MGLRKARKALKGLSDKKLARLGLARLPTDAAGETWHLGDEARFPSGVRAEVTGIRLGAGDTYVECGDLEARPERIQHVHQTRQA